MVDGSFQLSTTAEDCLIVWTVLNNLITVRSAVFGSWEEPQIIWLTVAKNAFVGWALNFKVHVIKRRSNEVGQKKNQTKEIAF